LIGCGALRGATVVVTADRDFDQLDKLVIGTTDPVTFTVERVAPK
jgi:hypothetical protein